MFNKISYLILAMLLLTSCGKSTPLDSTTLEENNVKTNTTVNMIESTKSSHAANVQLYRWYQFYERDLFDINRLNNQLDILDDNISIKTSAGTHTGKNTYPDRLVAYKGWKNSHQVQDSQVIKNDNGTLTLTANIVYQNIKADQSEDIYNIDYTMGLAYENESDLLPKFTTIEIVPTGKGEKKDFEDAYAVNRTKSLMYNWLLNMEQLDGNVEPFEEMLSENFQLDFSTATSITSIEQLKTWLNGAPLGLKQSSHFPENFSVQTLGDNEYEVNVEFDWFGVGKDDSLMRARTAHKWIVVDNPSEKFARIKSATVSQKEAFKVVTNEEFTR